MLRVKEEMPAAADVEKNDMELTMPRAVVEALYFRIIKLPP